MKTLFFILLISIFSCSWNENDLERGPSKEDVVKKFELDEEKTKKFAVEETPSTTQEPVVQKEVEETPKKESDKKTKKKEKLETKEELTKINSSKTKEEVVEKDKNSLELEGNTFSKEIVYPKNYPEIYKKYDERSKKFWESFKPVFPPNEKTVFGIKYLGVSVGKLVVRVLPQAKVGKRTTYHFYAKVHSSPFYRYIYELDDYVESYIDVEETLPVKYVLIQRESSQKVDDLQLFDRDVFKTYFHYNRVKKNRDKKESLEATIPYYVQDSFSAIFFVRGLPLSVGASYKFPIITRGKLWELSLGVVAREVITVKTGKVEAFKIKAATQFPGVLEKKGDILFWFSTSPEHRMLKFQGKVKIGALEGEVEEYEK